MVSPASAAGSRFRTDYPRKFSSSAPELTTAFDDERAPGPSEPARNDSPKREFVLNKNR